MTYQEKREALNKKNKEQNIADGLKPLTGKNAMWAETLRKNHLEALQELVDTGRVSQEAVDEVLPEIRAMDSDYYLLANGKIPLVFLNDFFSGKYDKVITRK